MTNTLYLSNTYSFELDASILMVEKDEKGSYILLDQTIFYPQGGGQPSDQGVLQGRDFKIKVVMVRQIEGEIRHYIDTEIIGNEKGQKVTCYLDQIRRILNAKYHTAGHLLGNVVEDLHPNLRAMKGHSFPNEAYVEFHGSDLPNNTKIQDELSKSINNNLKTKIFQIDQESFEQQFYKLPYPIPGNKAFRVMQIQGFSPIPCGGTHLSSTNEIGHMVITKIKGKNDSVRI